MPVKPGILIRCPHCNYEQSVPRAAISTVCKECRRHFLIDDARASSGAAKAKPTVAVRRVHCFDCGTELEPPVTAHNTMCKRCSSYVDLRDYQIGSAVSKNFRTAGQFVIEEKGYVFNAEVTASDVVLKGRFLGKIAALNSLTIFTTADIKATLRAARLVIPAGQCFWWTRDLEAERVEIEGDFVGVVRTPGAVHIAATGRLFGDVVASHVVIESGGVWVGEARIGTPMPGGKT